MKRFLKTLAGKTLLFIMCVACISVLAVSVVGILFYTQDGLVYYVTPEQDLTEQVISDRVLRSCGYNILQDELFNVTDSLYDFHYRIATADGDVVVESERFPSDTTQTYILTYRVVTNGTDKVIEYMYRDTESRDTENATEGNVTYYDVSLVLIRGTSTENTIHVLTKLVHIGYLLRYAIYGITLLSLLLTIACFVTLMHVSGRKPDTDEVLPGPFHKIPYDVLLVCFGFFSIVTLYVSNALTSVFSAIPVAIITCQIFVNMLLGLCMSAAGRIKLHTLLKTSLLYRIWKLIWKTACFMGRCLKKLYQYNVALFRGFPMIWKTVLITGGITITEFIFMIALYPRGKLLLCWLIEKLILIPLALGITLSLKKLKKSGNALAAGDLSYHTDTKGMVWDLKQHGENLNSIANGMSVVVEERLKSEHMKTELITNVSHDIKTPLTSIINYASLIGNESCDNPKIKEYSEVLVRQSVKLKRLIEDLVEASKAATGNLEVMPVPCDAVVFLSQASGEYEEKLRKADLTLITKQSENELRIMADGRRMWRIFDNLMSNICKYALPGTRVYLLLEEQNGNAVFIFKNTSRAPLDMSEEELMERFTRGDSSRNTEGNGLGLSIAKSMAELQGGSLHLSVDGDLFKATLTFPLI